MKCFYLLLTKKKHLYFSPAGGTDFGFRPNKFFTGDFSFLPRKKSNVSVSGDSITKAMYLPLFF